jgi:uncharacterized protein YdeI (YjbR/CyaY-like superfamily)
MMTDLTIISFETPQLWEKWLEENHAVSQGIWLRFYKKNSGEKTIVYQEALEVALCFGWIDSQVKKYDERSYLQKFTPRRSRSIWSKVNTEKVERLIKEEKMRPAGLLEVEKAKADGRWEKAYSSPSSSVIPGDFLTELDKNKKAKEFFSTLNKTNVYTITWRLETAKKLETRQKRIKEIIEMLQKEQKFY